MGASSCVVIGLNVSSDTGCEYCGQDPRLRSHTQLASGTSPATLCPIIIGFLVLIAAGIYEVQTNKDALFPAAVFTDLTIGECCAH